MSKERSSACQEVETETVHTAGSTAYGSCFGLQGGQGGVGVGRALSSSTATLTDLGALGDTTPAIVKRPAPGRRRERVRQAKHHKLAI